MPNKKLTELRSLVYLGIIKPEEYLIDIWSNFYLIDAEDIDWVFDEYTLGEIDDSLVFYDLQYGKYYYKVLYGYKCDIPNKLELHLTDYVSNDLLITNLTLSDTIDRFILCKSQHVLWNLITRRPASSGTYLRRI